MKLAIFHYHLRLDGVSTVITQSARILLEHYTTIQHIALVCGRLEHSDATHQLFTHHVKIQILRELDYIENIMTQIDDRTQGEQIYRRLVRMFEKDYIDYIWWIHNYHLGKNPFLTKAILHVLEKHPHHPCLLTIHDFPEDARYSLLHRMQVIAGADLYPCHPATCYHLINSEDSRRLIKAGIPKSHAVYIANPVDIPYIKHTQPLETRRRLEKAFSQSFPSYRKGKAYLLYPVRSIRRKNIFEALLIAKLMEENILVTLPGVSQQERRYSAYVQQAYKEELVSGMWGIGNMLAAHDLHFDDVFSAAQGIISSSIQEGFGYQYINAVIMRKPLIARDIPVIQDLHEMLMPHPHQLYREFLVPLPRDRIAELLNVYHTRLESLKLPKIIKTILEKQLDIIKKQQVIDFSLLEIPQQYQYLSSPHLTQQLSKTHRVFIESCRNCIRTKDFQIPEPSNFASDKTFASNMYALLDSLDSLASTMHTASGTGNISEKLMLSFVDLKQISFLLQEDGF